MVAEDQEQRVQHGESERGRGLLCERAEELQEEALHALAEARGVVGVEGRVVACERQQGRAELLHEESLVQRAAGGRRQQQEAEEVSGMRGRAERDRKGARFCRKSTGWRRQRRT